MYSDVRVVTVVSRFPDRPEGAIERLAEAAGLGRRSIINLEGAHHEPRVATLWAIAHGLDVPLSDLVKTLGR